MNRFFVSPEQIGEETVTITGEDVNHIRNVLRMREGEEVKICSGLDDREYLCRIRAMARSEVTLEILSSGPACTELPSRILLFQGLPKSDKMEWIIQKSVELGCAGIVPVAMHRSIVKIREGKEQSRLLRWNAIAKSAAEQSGRSRIPDVRMVAGFQEAVRMAKDLDVILFPYEKAEDMEHTRETLSALVPGQSIGIFIGPEGGFEETEAEALEGAGAKTITLGGRILRTETAGLAVLSMLGFVLEGRKIPV